MNVFTTKLSNIGNQFSLRFDSKYREIWDQKNGEIFKGQKQVKVGDLIQKTPIKKVPKGELDRDYKILNISDIEAKYGRLEESLQITDNIGSDKNVLDAAEFIVSKLVMSKGYIFTNESCIKDLIGSTELIPYIKRDKKIDLTFLRNVLLLEEYLLAYERLETGKTPSQKRVNPVDFLQLKIPYVKYEKQRSIGRKIRRYEHRLDLLNRNLDKRNDIINSVFSKEFNLDFNKIKQVEKPSIYTQKHSKYKESFDLRISYKYYGLKYANLLKELSKLPTKELKYFISEPIKLGSSISPVNYDDENGDAYYISMSSISKWKFDEDNTRKVSDEYFKENFVSSNVKKGDILVARSGEGTIGKVAILEEEYDGIFADFMMRVRISNSHNPKFFYYYFCSEIFQLLVEKEKKGLGNNTNFFPIQLKRFPIIEVSLEKQNEIVKKIDKEMIRINKTERLIQKIKDKIDDLLKSSF
ncbi:restriction endonuclease subunit S [Cytobacillus pseudoceanisediminis]|uniref:restriction endonuclease subunit S n=1 Tax=Cytobacillus pseudoceanisediminis TaxID=3051614 RepID=UPI003C30A829